MINMQTEGSTPQKTTKVCLAVPAKLIKNNQGWVEQYIRMKVQRKDIILTFYNKLDTGNTHFIIVPDKDSFTRYKKQMFTSIKGLCLQESWGSFRVHRHMNLTTL